MNKQITNPKTGQLSTTRVRNKQYIYLMAGNASLASFFNGYQISLLNMAENSLAIKFK